MAFPDAKAKAEPKKASLMGPLESADDASTEEDESSEDSSAAAGECFDALKADDREGFATALRALVATCK